MLTRKTLRDKALGDVLDSFQAGGLAGAQKATEIQNGDKTLEDCQFRMFAQDCSCRTLTLPLVCFYQTGPLGLLKVAAMPDQEELEAIAGKHPPSTLEGHVRIA